MHFYCSMRPLEIFIIDDSKADLDLMKYALERHQLAPNVVGFQNPDDCYKIIEKGAKPNMIFFDYKLPGTNGIECARKCRDLGWKGAGILTTAVFTDKIKSESFESKAIDERVVKTELCDKLPAKETLDKIIESGKCTEPLVVGIYGAGDQGKGIGYECMSLKNARGINCVSKIKYFSHFWNSEECREYLRTLPDGHRDYERNKEICCATLEEFFGSPKIDLLFITTGMHKKLEKWRENADKLTREQISGPLLEGSVPKIKRFIEEIKKYDFKGLGIVLTNVPEVHLMHIYNEIPLSHGNMTAVSGDYNRLRIAYRYLDRKNISDHVKGDVEFDDINFPMTGMHGGEIPLLSQGYVARGDTRIPLTEINTDILDPEKRIALEKAVAERTRPYGLRAARFENVHGTVAKDTVESQAELIKSISSFRPFYGGHIINLREVTGNKKDTLLGVTTLLLQIDRSEAPILMRPHIEGWPPYCKEEIAAQIREQNRLYEKYCRKALKLSFERLLPFL